MAVRTTRKQATKLLKEDHKAVQKLFKQFEKSDDVEEKRRIFDDVTSRIEAHAEAEEMYFYPALREGGGEAEEHLNEAHREHEEVKSLIEELDRLGLDGENFDEKMRTLAEKVIHHAEEEEEQLFPLFKKLPKERQQEISVRLIERLQQGAGDVPAE